MAKKQAEVQDSENQEVQTVKVKVPIIADGIVEDWEVKEVSAELAEEQLSLPKDQRNIHWKLVKRADDKEEGKAEQL